MTNPQSTSQDPQSAAAWIQTRSGVQFWPLEPRADGVRLEDIAHALANMCRFNGHVREFYSVAQHSVLVAGEMRRQGFPSNAVTAALFHDAAEAYLPVIPRPSKGAWKEFGLIEATLLATIFQALDIQQPSAKERAAIKHFDDVLLATEARDLLGPLHADWEQPRAPLATTITPWSPADSKRIFLEAALTVNSPIENVAVRCDRLLSRLLSFHGPVCESLKATIRLIAEQTIARQAVDPLEVLALDNIGHTLDSWDVWETANSEESPWEILPKT